MGHGPLAGVRVLEGRLPSTDDRENWPAIRARFAEAFRSRTRGEWAEHFAQSDACVTPVLATSEAASHPHNLTREVFLTRAGVTQPAPAPRFSRTPARPRRRRRSPATSSWPSGAWKATAEALEAPRGGNGPGAAGSRPVALRSRPAQAGRRARRCRRERS